MTIFKDQKIRIASPSEERAQLLAFTMAHVGHVFLEKTGAIEGGGDYGALTLNALSASFPRRGRAKKMRGSAPLEMFPLSPVFEKFCLMPDVSSRAAFAGALANASFANRGTHWVALDAGLVTHHVVQPTI